LHSSSAEVEEFLNGFVESMSRLLVDTYQKHFAELDLTLAQAQALRVLRRGALPTGQLAAELRISAPAVTQLTNRLTAKRLIERRLATSDRRLVLVALSAKGKRLVDRFRRRRGEIFCGAVGRLGEAEQTQVVEAMRKVAAALESYEPRAAAGEINKARRRSNNGTNGTKTKGEK
jgi:DNA-binding MarR family transcriptional regulator